VLQAEPLEESSLTIYQSLAERITNRDQTAITEFIRILSEERLQNPPPSEGSRQQRQPDISNCLQVIEAQLADVHTTKEYRGYLFAWLAAYYRDLKDDGQWRAYAERGHHLNNHQASYLLGNYFHYSERQHEQKAIEYYTCAAQQRHAYAEYELGLLLIRSKNTALANQTCAMHYFRNAMLNSTPTSELRKQAEHQLQHKPGNPEENYYALTSLRPLTNSILIKLLTLHPQIYTLLYSDELVTLDEKIAIGAQLGPEQAIIAISQLLTLEKPLHYLLAAKLLNQYFSDIISEKELLIFYLISHGHQALSDTDTMPSDFLGKIVAKQPRVRTLAATFDQNSRLVILPAQTVIKMADIESIPTPNGPMTVILQSLRQNERFKQLLAERYNSTSFITYEEILSQCTEFPPAQFLVKLDGEIIALKNCDYIPTLQLQQQLNRVMSADKHRNADLIYRSEQKLYDFLCEGLHIIFQRINKTMNEIDHDPTIHYLTINGLTAIFATTRALFERAKDYLQLNYMEGTYKVEFAQFNEALGTITPPFYVRLSPAALLEKFKTRVIHHKPTGNPEDNYYERLERWLAEFDSAVHNAVKQKKPDAALPPPSH
jgi:hypothetical protein